MTGRFSEFRDDLLLALVAAGWNTNDQLVPKDVANQAGLRYQPGWVREAIKTLEEQGLVRASFHLGGGVDGGMHVTVTGNGLERAEEIDDERKPFSDDQGYPNEHDAVVFLDRDSTEYQETLQKIDETIQKVRGSNDYDERDEQEQCTRELQAGRTLLEASRVRLEAVRVVLFRALRWLAEKFADHAIGTVAGAALTALAALLGVPITV